MALTEKQAVATSTTKANTGGISGALVPAISTGVIKFIEAYFNIDLDVAAEIMIVSIVTSAVTYWSVWFFPNKPIEANP